MISWRKMIVCGWFFLILGASAWGQLGGGGSIRSSKGDDGSFRPLMRVIRTAIEPDTWDEAGGPGSIEAVDEWGLLFVSQYPDVHEQIDVLIRTIRKAQNQQKNGGDAEKFDKPVSFCVEKATTSAFRKRAETALKEKTTLDFKNAPLQEVVEFLSKSHRLPFYIDTRALEDLGLGGDSPVTHKQAEVPLRTALKLMLGELGLVYLVREDVIQITSPDSGCGHLELKIYLVKDLAIGDGNPGKKGPG